MQAKYSMGMNNKKRRTLLVMSDHAFMAYELGLVVSRCCRSMDLNGALTAYSSAASLGVHPSADAFANLLSLAAGLGAQGSGCGTHREHEPPHSLHHALQVHAHMKRLGLSISEACHSALIRCCCLEAAPLRGFCFYRAMQAGGVGPKLRSFSSLLLALSYVGVGTGVGTVAVGAGVVGTALERVRARRVGFALYREMGDRYDIAPLERDYASLLRLCLPARLLHIVGVDTGARAA
ncbi:hypothetical protein B484DRAFT_404652, partial [Ochromonadaceae sp. CCMP2298]